MIPRHWQFAVGLACCVALAIPALGIASTDASPIRETVLANGLKVLTKELRAAPVVTVWTLYRAGSRNERPGNTGISHLLEHMLFRSTSSMKTGELDRLVQLAGGRHNAYTSYDYTGYHITLPSDRLETALRIEADRMLNCVLDPDELKKELGAVVSELQGRLNDPEELLEETTRATAFLTHPVSQPDHRLEGRRAVRDARGRAGVLPDPLSAQQRGPGHCRGHPDRGRRSTSSGSTSAALPSGPPPPPVTAREPPQKGERRVIVRGVGSTAHLQAFFHIPPAGHPDVYALAVLDGILTKGNSSRLHQALVETDLAAAVSSDLGRASTRDGWPSISRHETGSLTSASRAPLRRPSSESGEEGVTDRELQKAINQVRADLTMSHGSVSGVARAIGSLEMTVGYQEFDRVLDRIRQVTAADVQRVAQAYLGVDNRTIGWFVPKAGDQSSAPAAGGRRHRIAVRISRSGRDRRGPHPPGGGSTASPGRARRATGPPKWSHAHRGGESRWHAASPSRGTCWQVRSKTHRERPASPPLTAELVMRGTATHTAAELADRIDFLGASASIRAERETVGITAQMLTEHFDIVLGHLADCLRNPTLSRR